MPVALILFVLGGAFIVGGLITGQGWPYALSVACHVGAGILAILSDQKH